MSSAVEEEEEDDALRFLFKSTTKSFTADISAIDSYSKASLSFFKLPSRLFVLFFKLKYRYKRYRLIRLEDNRIIMSLLNFYYSVLKLLKYPFSRLQNNTTILFTQQPNMFQFQKKAISCSSW